MDVNIIPKLKKIDFKDGEVDASCIKWEFSANVDERIRKAAERTITNDEGGINVYINSGNAEDESYNLIIRKNGIEINSDGANGAFYALKTLSQLIKLNNGHLSCCEIWDSPDMSYRCFFQDISRGKIPKLETLKALVDAMAEVKLNSLQLYIEHTLETEAYKFCSEEFGCITKAEIRELDEYCKENFVELVPAIATFGHLYHLVENNKHLGENPDFVSTQHYWLERNHTLNPEKEESFELVKSILDECMELFSSDKINICCDEPHELCKFIKHDADKETLYLKFVKKLTEYVKSRGKKAMVFCDVLEVMEKIPEKISILPENVIYIAWSYGTNPKIEKVEPFCEKPMVVAAGTSSWLGGLNEDIEIEEPNISNLTKLGFRYGAFGLINTNWGDYGNIGAIELSLYGMICGGAASWNVETTFDDAFRKKVSKDFYGDIGIVDVLAELSKIRTTTSWYRQMSYHSDIEYDNGDKNSIYYLGNPWKIFKENLCRKDYEADAKLCKELYEIIQNKNFKSNEIKKEFLSTLQASALMIKWNAVIIGEKIETFVDYNEWRKAYKNNWLKKNKESELKEVLRVFDCCEARWTVL